LRVGKKREKDVFVESAEWRPSFVISIQLFKVVTFCAFGLRHFRIKLMKKNGVENTDYYLEEQ